MTYKDMFTVLVVDSRIERSQSLREASERIIGHLREDRYLRTDVLVTTKGAIIRLRGDASVACLLLEWGGKTGGIDGKRVLDTVMDNSVVELGDLLVHEGPARAAENAAAEIFGADRTYFVLNGTSTSNKIATGARSTRTASARPSGLTRWSPTRTGGGPSGPSGSRSSSSAATTGPSTTSGPSWTASGTCVTTSCSTRPGPAS